MQFLSIFVRLGWMRDRGNWTMRCQDFAGRRSTLTVRLAPGLVALESSMGLIYLSPLEVGRLRYILREAVSDLGAFGMEPPARRLPVRPAQAAAIPRQERRTIRLVGRERPRVADIVARLATEGRAMKALGREPSR
jgi:hypothetical protein